MADKTPVRVVFNASNVATGLAEFQSGDTVGTAFGGTGLTSIGSAGQVLKVNAAGNALEFAAEGDVSITNLVAPTNADLTFTTSGTGNIVLDAITVNGTTLSAADSTKITVAEALDVTGALTASGLAFPTSDGSANQFLKTDGSGNLAFADVSLGDFTFVGSTISNSSNADLSIQPSGTGNVLLGAIRINGTTLDSSDSSTININENVIIDGNLTVEGTVDFQDQNISNVGSLSLDSISGDADSNTSITFSGSDVITMATGGSTAATFNADQTTSFSGAVNITTTTTDASLLITTSEDSNSAAPVIELKRNSSSPADADYLGRLTFKGENDADQAVTYARISGKVLDASDGTEDGAIEFNTMKAGSSTISARLNSDELKLLNGTTLDVDGAGTFAGAVTATSITANDFTSNGSNADITIAPQGTGNIKLTAGADVIIPVNIGLHFADANEKIESDGSKLTLTSGGTAFNLPTSDGSAGQALVTDGAGNLSFDTVTTTVSDDTLAQVTNNKSFGSSVVTIDSLNATKHDSAFYFLVHNDINNESISAEMLAVTNNDSASFLGNRRGVVSASGSVAPTMATDVSNGQFRVRITGTSTNCKASFYKVPLSSTTADATRGNTVTTSNTDVDSASESIDTFAHATFRGAKYFISVDNDSKTEMDVVEALVVHDGSDAYILSYGHNSSGDNPLITLTAAISGDNVVVSAAGLETNLNLTIHKILLKDNMTAESNANQKAFAAVTVSSSATAIDTMDLDEGNGAVYFIVGANSSEGAFSIQEVYTAATPGVPAVAKGPFVSTKSTHQLDFTAGFDSTTDNSLELFASSTSGGSTTVSGYRISALAG